MKSLSFSFYQPILLVLLLHFNKKIRMSYEALTFLRDYQWQVNEQVFEENFYLKKALDDVEGAPAFLMLNKYALNITLNWLCNVHSFQGVHQRLIIFAFDYHSYGVLKRFWPTLHIVQITVPAMDRPFRPGDGRYQLFQLFRAQLCAFVAKQGRDFWIVQTDTYWRENLFEVIEQQETLSEYANLCFDQEGSSGLSADMIAGGNFFVRGQPRSAFFFQELSARLLSLYATDNNIMGSLCAYRFAGVECSFIPYSVISNWRWHFGDRSRMPSLLQFDGGDGSETKLQRMQKLGGHFANLDEYHYGHQICNHSVSATPGTAILKSFEMEETVSYVMMYHKTLTEYDTMNYGKQLIFKVPASYQYRLAIYLQILVEAFDDEYKGYGTLIENGDHPSRVQMVLSASQVLCEFIYKTFPSIGLLLRGFIFPHFAYYIIP